MKKTLLLFVLPLAVACAQTPTPKPAPAAKPVVQPGQSAVKPVPPVAEDAVVLTIGDEKITRAQFEDFINGLPEQVREQARTTAKRQLAEQIAELKTLSQEARKRKIDQTPAMKQQIAIQIDKTLAAALYQNLLESVKTDDAVLKAAYDKNKGQYEQVKASHILIRFKGSRVPLRPGEKDLTEEEALAKAQDIRKKILAGADFAATAKAESDDTGSGANGGELGQSFSRGQMVPEFDQAAFSLPVGQLSEPVKTPFGYHLIKVTEHAMKTFDEVKPELEKQIKPEQAKAAIEGLKKKTSVSYNENYFGPAAPPAPVAPGGMQ
jgi:peptidyl-prolyl cis-trans isomerase C